jgi:hypothetical protein
MYRKGVLPEARNLLIPIKAAQAQGLCGNHKPSGTVRGTTCSQADNHTQHPLIYAGKLGGKL